MGIDLYRMRKNFLNEIEKGEAEGYNKENCFWNKNSKINA